MRKGINLGSKEADTYVDGFSLSLPKDLPQGDYEFRSRVYLNGTEVRSNVNSIEVAVVWGLDDTQVVFASS